MQEEVEVTLLLTLFARILVQHLVKQSPYKRLEVIALPILAKSRFTS